MPKLKVVTTLPALIVEIYDGYLNLAATLHGSSNAIPHFKPTNTTEIQAREAIIETDLKIGLYKVRFSLPYFSGPDPNQPGEHFPMAVMMDEHIALRTEDQVIEMKFCPTLQIK